MYNKILAVTVLITISCCGSSALIGSDFGLNVGALSGSDVSSVRSGNSLKLSRDNSSDVASNNGSDMNGRRRYDKNGSDLGASSAVGEMNIRKADQSSSLSIHVPQQSPEISQQAQEVADLGTPEFDQDLRDMPDYFDADQHQDFIIPNDTIPKKQPQETPTQFLQRLQAFKVVDNTIQSIFQDADAWIAKNSVTYSLSKNKKSILNRKVYNALRQLEQKIRQPGSLQQFSKMFATAVDFFDTTTIVGRGQGSIENKIFAGLINGTKTAVATLLKSSVVLSSGALGAASGAAGGAVMGLGAGAARLVSGADVHDFVKNNLVFKIDQPSAQMGKIFVNSVVTSLHNIVQVPVLISYGAVEGVILGGVTGAELAANIGTKIKIPAFELRKNERVAKLQDRLKSIQQDMEPLEYNKKQAELILPILDKIIENPQNRNLQVLRMRELLDDYITDENTVLTLEEKQAFNTMSKSSKLFNEGLSIREMRASYGRSMQQAQ